MALGNNVQKFISYARRNGIGAAINAAVERLDLNREPYDYEPPTEETLRAQRAFVSRRLIDRDGAQPPKFSILVPLYRTNPAHLTELIASVKAQSYGEWELILADASPKGARLEKTVTDCAQDGRVGYVALKENGGISANTNAALLQATGDYVVLLDHDDLLTPDALYEIERAINDGGKDERGAYRCLLAYSDEDKFADDKDGARRYFELHRKPEFDFDRLLSNNYICHLTAIRADVAKRLRLRGDYDGSQDYDLFLRVVKEAVFDEEGRFRNPEDTRARIRHTSKVLYHWRSHEGSTASNPQSKRYAYDAGKRAIEDFLQTVGIAGEIAPLPHLGFYRMNYRDAIFAARPDVGVVGGKVTDAKGALIGGKMTADGGIFYEGLSRENSGGFQHPAVLQQEAEAVDLRCLKARGELHALYEEIVGRPYADVWEVETNADTAVDPQEASGADATAAGENAGTNLRPSTDIDAAAMASGANPTAPATDINANAATNGAAAETADAAPSTTDNAPALTEDEIREKSLAFCKAARQQGYRILWDPQEVVVWRT